MSFSNHSTIKRNLGIALCSGMLLGQSAHAAIVSASYQGIIDSDSGLGLVGQTLRFDFTYDDSVAPTTSYTSGPLNDHAEFYDYLTSMTVTIGANSWVWDGGIGNSAIFLTNNGVHSYAIGAEDRVTGFTSGFNGTELVSAAHSYSAYLFLSDNASLTGLNNAQVLPNPAPDADLFTRSEGNLLQLEFYTPDGGDPWGNYYLIETSGVSNVSSVPIPSAIWLFGSFFAGLLGVARRNKA